MRVLHVVSSDRFAGVERYIAYVAPALVARGCEVTVIGGDPAAMRAELDGTGVHFMPARDVLGTARRAAAVRKVDVIHAHMTAAEWAVVPLRPFTRAAFVTTRHFAAVRGQPGVVRTLSRLIPRIFDQQLAISAFVAASIEEPATVLPNGVPVREPVAVGTRDAVVLVLQRLEAEKDTSLALDAWARSSAMAQGWRLQIAGKGSLEAALAATAVRLGVERSVDFLGHRSDAPALLDRAGLFLATAPFEPFGLSVVEAMAAGVGVVAAAGGAHLETVGSCSEEHLFPPGDVAGCAARLDALIADPDRREAYGKALQAHQREHFSVDLHVDRLLAVYEGLLRAR